MPNDKKPVATERERDQQLARASDVGAGGRWNHALGNLSRDAFIRPEVPDDLRVRARKYALDQRTTLSEIVIKALDEFLKKRGA